MQKYQRITLLLLILMLTAALVPSLQAGVRLNVANSRFDLQTEEKLLTNG